MNTYQVTTVYSAVKITGRSLPETLLYTRTFDTEASLEEMTKLCASIYMNAQSITVEQVS